MWREGTLRNLSRITAVVCWWALDQVSACRGGSGQERRTLGRNSTFLGSLSCCFRASLARWASAFVSLSLNREQSHYPGPPLRLQSPNEGSLISCICQLWHQLSTKSSIISSEKRLSCAIPDPFHLSQLRIAPPNLNNLIHLAQARPKITEYDRLLIQEVR